MRPKAKQSGGRERLAQAARDLFREAGYAEVSVAQVLERAGVQAPTLYHHYGDKESLYVAWAQAELAALGDRIQACSTHGGLRGALSGIAEAVLEAPFDLEQLHRDIRQLSDPKHRETLLAAYLSMVYSPLAAAFVRSAARNEVSPGPIAPRVETFLAGVEAIRRTWRAGEADGGPSDWWAEHFVRGCGESAERAVVDGRLIAP